jgi:hypothetical protein
LIKKLLEVIVVVFVCGIILKKITSGFVLIVSFVNASRSVDVVIIVTIIFVGVVYRCTQVENPRGVPLKVFTNFLGVGSMGL